jgi:hypothetical protein
MLIANNSTQANSCGGTAALSVPVPEPSTLVLAALGRLALLAGRRRRYVESRPERGVHLLPLLPA